MSGATNFAVSFFRSRFWSRTGKGTIQTFPPDEKNVASKQSRPEPQVIAWPRNATRRRCSACRGSSLE